MCGFKRGESKLLGGGKGGVSDIGSSWACTQCTVLNSASSSVCSVCGASRQPLQEVQAFDMPEQKMSSVDALTIPPLERNVGNARPSNPIADTLKEVDVASASWTCAQCTYAGNTGQKCAVCGADKPKEPVSTASASTGG